MLAFLKTFMREVFTHGKMLLGYAILLLPAGQYPMLEDAIKKAMDEPTAQNLTVALGQAILALGASHRVVKILRGVAGKM